MVVGSNEFVSLERDLTVEDVITGPDTRIIHGPYNPPDGNKIDIFFALPKGAGFR